MRRQPPERGRSAACAPAMSITASGGPPARRRCRRRAARPCRPASAARRSSPRRAQALAARRGVEEDRLAGRAARSARCRRAGRGSSAGATARDDERVDAEQRAAARAAPVRASKAEVVDLDHGARDARRRGAAATRANSASSKPAARADELQVGLAVDRAHRGAELGQRRALIRCTEKASATPSITASSAAPLRHGWWRSSGQRQQAQQRRQARAGSRGGRCARSAACDAVGGQRHARGRRAPRRRASASPARRPRLLAHLLDAAASMHPVGGGGVEVAGRLVGQDQLRPVHQRAGDRHPLQLAARERLRQPRARGRPGRPRPAPRRRARRRAGPAAAAAGPTFCATLRCGSTWKAWNTKPRWRRRNSACAGSASASMSVPSMRTVPASTRVEPGDAVQQRRLADAGLAEHGDEFAGADARDRRRSNTGVAVALGERRSRGAASAMARPSASCAPLASARDLVHAHRARRRRRPGAAACRAAR